MKLSRPPKAALRPFITLLWASDGASRTSIDFKREQVLPTGAMHVAIRLEGAPLRLFADAADTEGTTIGAAVIGGVRDTAYIKEVATHAPMVGALLRPGVVDLLSGTPAGELAGCHTRLEDLWPSTHLLELHERLANAASLDFRVVIFEEMLGRRLPRLGGVDPLISHALQRFAGRASVAEVVAECGFSHRHLVRVFTEAVGVPPKTWLRIVRFNRTLDQLCRTQGSSLADIAAVQGFADQAHLTREFRAISGVTPGNYRRIAPLQARHVPMVD